MSATPEYLRGMRDKRDIQGHAREILRLLMRTHGPVTRRLMEYHIWERRGINPPSEIRHYFSHIRTITGLGIRHYLPQRSYALDAHLNEHWCTPEAWEAIGAD